MFYQPNRNDEESILQGSDLEEFIQTWRMPTLHDPEDTSEDETVRSEQLTAQPASTEQLRPQLTQASLDKDTEPTMFPTPAPTSPSHTTVQRSQSIQSLTRSSHDATQNQQEVETTANYVNPSRKRRRDTPADTNKAQNRELIDGNLRSSHILSEGSTRPRKPTRKSSSFFISAY